MKSARRKPLKFAPRPNPREKEREQRQSDFLRYLAQGESIEDACTLVGVTRFAYEKWRDRHKGFRAAVAAAREHHRRDIACGFHTADAYARMLLDAIQRDEAQPAGLRYRAAKSILTRTGKADWHRMLLDAIQRDEAQPASLRYRAAKSILTRNGKADWLPEPLPADAAPLEPYEDEQPEFRETGSPETPCTDTIPREMEPEPAPGPTAPAPSAPASITTVLPPEPSSPEPTRKPVLVSAAIDLPRTAQTQPENPDNPDNPAHSEIATNPLQNRRDTVTQTAPAQPLQFSENPDKPEIPESIANPQSAPAATTTATETDNASKTTAMLSQTWLSAHFLHKHESKPAFETLLAKHIHAYAPATPAEELLVFRITQKTWLLHRLETWERVIADSTVAKVRQQHPSAAAPACLALSLLEAKETQETRFHHRTAAQRKDHESALDRLESNLFQRQQRSARNAPASQGRSMAPVNCGQSSMKASATRGGHSRGAATSGL